MFVSLTHADEIRLVRRTQCDDSDLKQCEMRALSLAEVAKKLEKAAGKPVGTYSAETLKPRLHILGTDLAEGFFADGVVLVEGRSDKAALFATARLLDFDFEAAGIAVISVEGKNNLDRPYVIFRELGIPVYIAGYYTFAATSIPLADLAPEVTKRLPRYALIPAGLIGRLAVDQRYQGQRLGGALVIDAVKRSAQGDPAIFALVVDAKDDTAVAFYRHLGFLPFTSRAQSLYLPIATALKAIER